MIQVAPLNKERRNLKKKYPIRDRNLTFFVNVIDRSFSFAPYNEQAVDRLQAKTKN